MSFLALIWTYRRWVGYAAIAVAAAGLLWYGSHVWSGYRERDAAVAHAKAVEAQAARELADMARRYSEAQKASEGYQNELAANANRPVRTDPVRLCRPAGVPKPGAVAGGPGATVSAAGVVSGSDGTDNSMREGRDIGPALRSLARRADDVSAQGRAVQSLSEK